MSWPHILSFSRIVAGPIVAALVLAPPGNSYLIAALLFAAASFTDLIDGKLARYSRSESALGIFLDTTADKVMVSLVLVAMAIAGLAQAWIPLVVAGREFLISGLRSYAASRDVIIPARIWGKGKAAVTMIAILCVLVAAGGATGGRVSSLAPHATWETVRTASSWLLGLAAALTVISGATYIFDALPLFRAGDVPEDHPQHIAAGGER
jgi:CDP-diacylglycerol--glycerol-3-phosphate 3-phosphatidyltransferase